MSVPADPLLAYLLRQGDRALVLAQRLLESVTHAPEIEEDMALSNLALDLIGQARTLYAYAGEVEGAGHDEDHFAYWREPDEFLNPLLVERPNGDFAHLIVRQFLHDAFALPYWRAMVESTDATLSALAGKAVKETAYHLRHPPGVGSSGSATEPTRAIAGHSRRSTGCGATPANCSNATRVEHTLVATGVAADPDTLRTEWDQLVEAALDEATLPRPDSTSMQTGGRTGRHTEEFSYLVGELQVVARAHPGATW